MSSSLAPCLQKNLCANCFNKSNIKKHFAEYKYLHTHKQFGVFAKVVRQNICHIAPADCSQHYSHVSLCVCGYAIDDAETDEGHYGVIDDDGCCVDHNLVSTHLLAIVDKTSCKVVEFPSIGEFVDTMAECVLALFSDIGIYSCFDVRPPLTPPVLERQHAIEYPEPFMPPYDPVVIGGSYATWYAQKLIIGRKSHEHWTPHNIDIYMLGSINDDDYISVFTKTKWLHAAFDKSRDYGKFVASWVLPLKSTDTVDELDMAFECVVRKCPKTIQDITSLAGTTDISVNKVFIVFGTEPTQTVSDSNIVVIGKWLLPDSWVVASSNTVVEHIRNQTMSWCGSIPRILLPLHKIGEKIGVWDDPHTRVSHSCIYTHNSLQKVIDKLYTYGWRVRDTISILEEFSFIYDPGHPFFVDWDIDFIHTDTADAIVKNCARLATDCDGQSLMYPLNPYDIKLCAQGDFRTEHIPVFYNVGNGMMRKNRHVFGSFIRLCRADPERLFRNIMPSDKDGPWNMKSFLGIKHEFWHCIDMHGVLWCVGRCVDADVDTFDACKHSRGYAWPGMFIDDTRVNLGIRDLVCYMNGGDERVCRHVDNEILQTLHGYDVRAAQCILIADLRSKNRTFCDGCLECFDCSPARIVCVVRNDKESDKQTLLCKTCVARLVAGEHTITKQWYNYVCYHTTSINVSSQIISRWKAYHTSMQRLEKYTKRLFLVKEYIYN